MKSGIMTALMGVAVCLLMTIPVAQASDWSNGDIACDLEVKELAPWYEVLNWGKWSTLHVKYSLISRPESSLTYLCYAALPDRIKFACRGDSNAQNDRERLAGSSAAAAFTFNPGTTEAQACEAIFNWYNIKKK